LRENHEDRANRNKANQVCETASQLTHRVGRDRTTDKEKKSQDGENEEDQSQHEEGQERQLRKSRKENAERDQKRAGKMKLQGTKL
jgi:hypothetical protein